MKNNLHNDIKMDNDRSNDTVRMILERSEKLEVPFTLTNEEAYKRLQSKIATNYKELEKPEGRNIKMIYYLSSAAALMLVLIGIWQVLLNPATKDVLAPKGEHAELQLPDGSRISLNSDSKISYKAKNFNKNRKVLLEGEAFFNVQKGSTFTIKTEKGDIQILGTSFNVYSRDNILKVSCFTGKVRVTSGSQTEIITPGQSALVENDILSKNIEKDINNTATWRNGEFNYVNIPLKSVLDEIERQFNVTFVRYKVDNLTYSGNFTNENLVKALNIVCEPMGLKYEIGRNSQISILPK